MKDFVFGLVVASIIFITICGINILYESKNVCEITACTEDSAVCIGNTIIFPTGVYKGNQGKVIDVSEFLSTGHVVTVLFCNGQELTYIYKVKRNEEI